MEFDGVRWEPRAGSEGRHWHGMAFDEARGVTILYEVKVDRLDSNDFWMEINGNDGTVWTELTLPNPGSATAGNGL